MTGGDAERQDCVDVVEAQRDDALWSAGYLGGAALALEAPAAPVTEVLSSHVADEQPSANIDRAATVAARAWMDPRPIDLVDS